MRKIFLVLVSIMALGVSTACLQAPTSTPSSVPTQLPAIVIPPATLETPESTPDSPTPTSTPVSSSPAATSSPSTSTAPPATIESKTTISFNSRTLTNNVWGAPPDESLNSAVYLNPDQTYGWYWSREDPHMNPGFTLFHPIFPCVRVGGGPTIKSNSKYFPVRMADVASLNFNVDYKYLEFPSGAYNLAYEMFFSDTNQPNANLIPKAEIMVWVHATFGQPPSTDRGIVSDGKNNYRLYAWFREDGRFYASFNMEGNPQFEGQHTVDVKKLLSNLKEMDPKWYLLGVELGSEIVSGSGKIKINQFDINLNGNKP